MTSWEASELVDSVSLLEFAGGSGRADDPNAPWVALVIGVVAFTLGLVFLSDFKGMVTKTHQRINEFAGSRGRRSRGEAAVRQQRILGGVIAVFGLVSIVASMIEFSRS